MTKKELITKTAIKTDQTIDFTTRFFNDFVDVLIECITNNEEVVLSPKIGKFVLKTGIERKIKRITDQKIITIPARTVIKFKFSKSIKDKVKDLELE